jgi:hypothetical protein
VDGQDGAGFWRIRRTTALAGGLREHYGPPLPNAAVRDSSPAENEDSGAGDYVKPRLVERMGQIRFTTWELLAGLTVASVAFGVLKWLGFETTWGLLMAAATVGAAVDPAWRIYRWWREA